MNLVPFFPGIMRFSRFVALLGASGLAAAIPIQEDMMGAFKTTITSVITTLTTRSSSKTASTLTTTNYVTTTVVLTTVPPTSVVVISPTSSTTAKTTTTTTVVLTSVVVVGPTSSTTAKPTSTSSTTAKPTSTTPPPPPPGKPCSYKPVNKEDEARWKECQLQIKDNKWDQKTGDEFCCRRWRGVPDQLPPMMATVRTKRQIIPCWMMCQIDIKEKKIPAEAYGQCVKDCEHLVGHDESPPKQPPPPKQSPPDEDPHKCFDCAPTTPSA